MTLLQEYQDYVNDVKLSEQGSSTVVLTKTLNDHHCNGVDICRLLCGAIGQSAESGELLVEALLPTSPKLIDELGDVLFYTMVSARTLNLNISENINKVKYEYLEKENILSVVQSLVVTTAEYLDIVKKILFQGKPIDGKLYEILINKICYQYDLIQIIAYKLEVPVVYVIMVNKNKLDKRYKSKFTVEESENKK